MMRCHRIGGCSSWIVCGRSASLQADANACDVMRAKYVVVYFSILHFRYHAGIVTDEMLSLPKIPFLGVGLLEALAAASGMAAGGIAQFTSLVSCIVCSLLTVIMASFHSFWGINSNIISDCVHVISGSGAGVSMKEAGIFWNLLMITSFLLQAADTVLKGVSVDLFVVNSFGSAYQALFIFLLLPFLSNLWGIPFSQLPAYLKDGAACFLNIGSLSSGMFFFNL
ncbi:hypothetical protein ACLOJK_024665 [Asimina triloba]